MKRLSRTKRCLAAAFSLSALALLSLAVVAFADTIKGDAVNQVVSGVDPINASVTKAPGESGAGKFALVVDDNATDPVNGCNAGGANPPVVLAVSSNKTWLTLTQSTISLTNCDTGTLADGLQNAATVNYAVASDAPAGETATVTAAYQSGGKPGGSYTPGSFTVQTPAAPPNTAPTTPGKPGLAAGSTSPNQGILGLTWAASTDAESNPITYRLEHRDANDLAYSLVPGAGSLGSNSFSFTAAAKEAEGTWTYQARASDGSLNSAFSAASDPIKVDRSAPTAPNASTDRSPEDSAGNWFKDTVTVSYSGSTDPSLADGSAGSGVASHGASQTFNTSGTHDYSGKATDNAGNESSATTGQVKVDATDPQVQITSGCPSGLVARDSSQSISVSASDAHSGLVSDPSGSVALDTSTAGEQTKKIEVEDRVGHEASASCVYTVNSTPTKPGTPQVSSTPNQGAFTVSWTASSDTDGNLDHYLLQHKDGDDAGYTTVANVPAGPSPSHEFTSSSPEAEGTWTYRVIAVDELDEEGPASDESGSAKVDRTAPSAPSASTTPSTPDFGDWFKDSVTVSYSGSADPDLPDGSLGSGVASYTASQQFNTSGTHNYSGTATDAAGNESTAASGQVKVDATDPTVGISGCPTGNVPKGSSQSITVSASDAHSGLVSDPSGSVELDTSSIGPKTRTIEVEDNVGHKQSDSCAYNVIYDYSGFYAPIDNPQTGKINAIKAGSSVPIKFSLNGYQGMYVLDGAPTSKQITCDAAGSDLSTDTPIASAGSSTLSYEPVSDQYSYVWKTEKAWAGQCRKLTIRLADGTFYPVNFKAMK